MLNWLLQRRIMVGGLYFGPPAWSPDHIEGLAEPAHAASATTPETPAAGESLSPTPPAPKTPPSHQDRDCRAFLQLLQRAGFGEGGDAQTSAILPSLADQVHELADRRIRSLVLNLLPAQPEYALHSALSRAALPDLLEGLAIIQEIVRARRITVVIDRHDWLLRRIWKRAAATGAGRITFEVVTLLNKYPQAHHTILLRSLFNKKIGPHELPTLANRFIVDPVACWALGRYTRLHLPMTDRPVQLFVRTDKRDVAPRVVMGHIGENLETFLERHGIQFENRQIILNGMLAGEQADPQSTIATDTESVSIRARPEPEVPTTCIACGWCLDLCPTALNPIGLYELSRKTDAGNLERASPARLTNARESLYCIGCGLCSYVCPTRLPLTQGILDLQALAARTAGAGAAPRTVDPVDTPASDEGRTP